MDDWIRQGLRTDPIVTLGKMLRRGVIAFEAPTVRVLHHHGLPPPPRLPLHFGEGVMCGICVRMAAEEIRDWRARVAWLGKHPHPNGLGLGDYRG